MIEPIMGELEIYETTPRIDRRTGIHSYFEYGICDIDNRTPEERREVPERHKLSPEDRAAKRRVEDFVRAHSRG